MTWESPTSNERAAKHHLEKLIREVQKGVFSIDKMDLLLTNPDEFLDEYLSAHKESDRNEIRGIIKKTIIAGFFRLMQKKGSVLAAMEDIDSGADTDKNGANPGGI